ncbi:MAG TPA: phosphoribosyltransferase family protein [Actinomycetota bacterium]|nr:phosphoribosyltransferase family protein [Actinomycetota bacterium]
MAEALGDLAGTDAVILGIPRGGVLVAAEVSRALGLPLDVVVPRKIGAPSNPELGIGAVAPGVRVLDAAMIRRLDVGPAYLEREIAAQEREIERRSAAYRGGRPSADIAGRTAVVVDDGVATGGTAVAALRWARARGAREVVLAVPVAPAQAVPMLARECDRIVVLETPEPFTAVGEWYRRFGQASDADVVEALGRRAGD